MSTRSVIARKNGAGFKGVYHHWDGYPAGLGATLFEIRNGHFKGDTQAMLKYLIDEHPAGWSTIVGADFSLPPGPRPDHNLLLCKECYRPLWVHFKQYYTEFSDYWKKAGRPPIPENSGIGYKLFSCSATPFDVVQGPCCFTDTASNLADDNASECGCEYAYVFDGNGEMLIQSSYRQDGAKMIGMFGCGDPEAKWKTIAAIDLDGKEPNWDKIEA